MRNLPAGGKFWPRARRMILVLAAATGLTSADDKPMGAPLVLSSIETEQGVPLAVLSPDGQTASCVTVRVHWNPLAQIGPNDDATSFTLDIASDAPGAAIFTAELWNASLASALAWQEPWEGARWKILDTPAHGWHRHRRRPRRGDDRDLPRAGPIRRIRAGNRQPASQTAALGARCTQAGARGWMRPRPPASAKRHHPERSALRADDANGKACRTWSEATPRALHLTVRARRQPRARRRKR